jgi:low affinity Fe/Cu permease
MNPNAANRLAIATSVAAVLLLCAFATGKNCSTPAPLSERLAVSAEITVPENQDANVVATHMEVSLDDELNKVRQAARDLVKSALPNLKQDGVFTLAIRYGDLYIAGVDTADGNKKRTIDVLVRRYVRKNGATYYRAESLTPEQAAKYAEMAE